MSNPRRSSPYGTRSSGRPLAEPTDNARGVRQDGPGHKPKPKSVQRVAEEPTGTPQANYSVLNSPSTPSVPGAWRKYPSSIPIPSSRSAAGIPGSKLQKLLGEGERRGQGREDLVSGAVQLQLQEAEQPDAQRRNPEGDEQLESSVHLAEGESSSQREASPSPSQYISSSPGQSPERSAIETSKVQEAAPQGEEGEVQLPKEGQSPSHGGSPKERQREEQLPERPEKSGQKASLPRSLGTSFDSRNSSSQQLPASSKLGDRKQQSPSQDVDRNIVVRTNLSTADVSQIPPALSSNVSIFKPD